GRLVSYKRFDLAIRVFNQNGLKLKIVGLGPELNKLKKIANKNIEFMGLVSDKQLADLYANAKACIFPQEEDFGIVPLESMASGRPVIAYRAGGALETVIENKTGIFFDEQNIESLQMAIEKFHNTDFSPEACREQAERFDIEVFKNNILEKLT
ncbi:MAG: glycosyltransferase, partial [Candidatus Levybacteria bacterium]|nr:glycosyltransferase [Candidatus Levybacteria bacterium]